MLKMKVDFKTKVSWALLLIIILNLLGNIMIPMSKVSASELTINPKGKNIIDEFFPKSTLDEESNWTTRVWASKVDPKQGVIGNKDGKGYRELYTSNRIKTGGALKILEDEAGYIVRMGHKVNLINSEGGSTYYAYNVSVISDNDFKKDHIYKLDLKYDLKSDDPKYNKNDLQKLSIRVGSRTDTAGIDISDIVLENTMFENNGWKKIGRGSYSGSILIKGNGERLVLGGHYSPTVFTSDHIVRDLKLYDITPASEPDKVSSLYLGDKNISGISTPSDKDKRTIFEGDVVFIYKNEKKIGHTVVDKDNNWNYKFEETLEVDDIITIQIVNPSSGLESKKVSEKVIFIPENHKPELGKLEEGEEKITGKGTPGDEIVITDENGEELGTGKVGEDGSFEVELKRPLKPGETITATPETNGNKGESVEKEVVYDAEMHKPEITEAKEGERVVKGKGIPGDEIVITDEEGKKLGTSKVGEDGNFEVDLNRPLKEGEDITAVAESGNKKSEESTVTVTYEASKHKPEITEAKEGEKVVKGKGIPGDEIVITDENGEELGTGKVGEDGNFEVELKRPLKPGEIITATPETNGNKGESVEKEVVYDAEMHKPEITEAKEGERVVKGKGVPGDEIVITDENGEELGTGKVGEDGSFEVELKRPLKPGEIITATPETNGNKGESVEKEVVYDAEMHKPEITEAKEGERVVKGKGIPGDEIVITDEEGKKLGTGKVGEDGNFEVDLNRPLKEGEDITAVAESGNKKSEESTVTVTYEASKHKPEITEAKEGEKVVKGKGVPGDEIVITDENGEELGRAKVGEDGSFKVDVNRPLNRGEIITATPKTNGNKGEIDQKEVIYHEKNHKPELDKPKEDSDFVTGKGIPGDEIVITDEDGEELGTGKVGEDGNFEVNLNRPLKPGETITATPKTDGNIGTSVDEEVVYNEEKYKPVIEEAKEGKKYVSGKGIPGSEIIIKDEEGKELGKGKVDKDGNFEIGLDRELIRDEIIKAIPDLGGILGEPGIKEVEYNPEVYKPNIKEAIGGKTEVKGLAKPGYEIVITDEEGKELGSGKVDEDGSFEITTNRPLKEGEKISAVAVVKDEESAKSEVEVTYNSSTHTPKIDKVKEGDKEIKGTGTPGDEIVITDENGKELGSGKVDEDGNFTVDLNRPLNPEEAITVIPKTGNNNGDPVEEISKYVPELHTVKITEAKEGEKLVKGKGTPGDDVIINDEQGVEIGRGKVNEDGYFTVDLVRKLKGNEKITAISEINGIKGLPDEKIIDKTPSGSQTGGGGGGSKKPVKEDHTIKVNDIKEGDKSITGKGRPGDKVIVVDRNGKEIGEGKIDKDGNFNIKIDKDLIEKDKLEIIPIVDGKEGTAVEAIVLGNEKELEVYEHIAYIQGYKDGSVRPNVEISRQEVAAALYRLLPESQRNKYYTLNHDFKDIKIDQWSRKHIATLSSLGIVKGDNDKFRPYDNITRAELVTMVMRFTSFINESENVENKINSQFTDIKGHWAEINIKSAESKDWIKGYEDGTFKPNKDITRAEFVTVINNALDRRVKSVDALVNIKRFTDLQKTDWYYEVIVEASNSHSYERKKDGNEVWINILNEKVDW